MYVFFLILLFLGITLILKEFRNRDVLDYYYNHSNRFSSTLIASFLTRQRMSRLADISRIIFGILCFLTVLIAITLIINIAENPTISFEHNTKDIGILVLTYILITSIMAWDNFTFKTPRSTMINRVVTDLIDLSPARRNPSKGINLLKPLLTRKLSLAIDSKSTQVSTGIIYTMVIPATIQLIPYGIKWAPLLFNLNSHNSSSPVSIDPARYVLLLAFIYFFLMYFAISYNYSEKRITAICTEEVYDIVKSGFQMDTE